MNPCRIKLSRFANFLCTFICFLVLVSLHVNVSATPQDKQQPSEADTQLSDLETKVEKLLSRIAEQDKELRQLKRTQAQLLREIKGLTQDKLDKHEYGPARKLFDGKTMNGWEASSYGGEGDCSVIDGAIQMLEGDPVTGINLKEEIELPKHNYEVSFRAKKIEGNDFFGSLTFPVNESFCTLVVGGWGGTLVGLSSLDGKDASENGTRVLRKFERDRWYFIRVRVLKDRIIAWIDEDRMVDESIVGREVTIRGDITPSRPLGITSFITTAAIKDIEIRDVYPFTDNSKNQ